MGFNGGRGSCLAVTAQYVGNDEQWWTDDDVYDADLNAEPAFISGDLGVNEDEYVAFDRVRPFLSAHPGGAVFSNADGSVRFISDDIDRRAYIIRSQISDGEVTSE